VVAYYAGDYADAAKNGLDLAEDVAGATGWDEGAKACAAAADAIPAGAAGVAAGVGKEAYIAATADEMIQEVDDPMTTAAKPGKSGPRDWAAIIERPGGVDKLLDAAMRGDESARKFLESKEGALAVQRRMEEETRFNTALSNLLSSLHEMQMTAIRNLRA
jgi:hypothetical protein